MNDARGFCGNVDSDVRNPELDTESKEMLQIGIQTLTEQFSTLMLKELKRVLLDYEGIRLGNAVVRENTKVLLAQALELYEPIKVSKDAVPVSCFLYRSIGAAC